MNGYLDPTKKKSVLYLEAMQNIQHALNEVRNSIDNLKQTVANQPRDMTASSIIAALAPLNELAKTAAPFLKEIMSNEFVSAITSKNAELEEKNHALETERDELRRRLNLLDDFAKKAKESASDGAETPQLDVGVDSH